MYIPIFYIYEIKNVKNGRIYIGRTECLYHRKRAHLYQLKKGTHYSKEMCEDYKEYGENSFAFSILTKTKNYYKSIKIEVDLIKDLQPSYNKKHTKKNLKIKFETSYGL